jgi:hypothetical protein
METKPMKSDQLLVKCGNQTNEIRPNIGKKWKPNQ